MRKFSLLIAMLSVCVVSPVFADDVSITYPSMTLSDVMYSDHQDAAPFKGLATVTVTNTGVDPWGDFHFEIYNGFGGNATSVLFKDASMGGQDPVSTQAGTTWAIGTTPGGYSKLDLFFYGDPVAQGETATFTVYTDNTAQSLSWFGMMIYPTPVPEPATMVLLGLGSLALLRRKK